jgi:hypothetical protein
MPPGVQIWAPFLPHAWVLAGFPVHISYFHIPIGKSR